MEANINVLVDQQGLYPEEGSSPPFTAFSSCSNNTSKGANPCLLRSSSQQLFLDVPGMGVGGGAGFLGPRPPPYSSGPPPFPAYSLLPSHLLQQPHPPLLPIPPLQSTSLLSSSPPASTRRTNKDFRKSKSHPNKLQKDYQFGGAPPQKEPFAMTTPINVPKSATAVSHFKDELPKEEADLAGDVYSLSPPPSSLPMPRFSLRARAGAEAFAGADAGASDDLRRLLRLY